MIKFFRRIRQSLLTENKPAFPSFTDRQTAGKFSKYLLYAIGEILLVVIGILLALQINTWNTNRINKNEEERYIDRLVLDLERDILKIQEVIENYEKRLILGVDIGNRLGKNNLALFETRNSYLNALNNYNKNKDWMPDSFGGSLYHVLTIALFKSSDVTFQELLSTGKIDLIKNQDLKVAIQEYYLSASETQRFQDEIIMTVQQNYRNALIENHISNLNRSSYFEISKELKNVESLITSLENYLDLSDAVLNGWGLYELKDDANDLIQMIKNVQKD